MSNTPSKIPTHLLAFLAGCAGIAVFGLMDAAMKELALAMGALAATFFRNIFNTLFAGTVFALQRHRWPGKRSLFHHVRRAIVIAVMSVLFFHGITILPLAESIGLSFVSPVIALFLASILLGERISNGAIAASILGLAGVGVILAGQMSGVYRPDAIEGAAAVIVSACLYAYNLILARQQAQVANAVEISFFQPAVVALVLLPAIVLFPPDRWPNLWQWGIIAAAGALAMVALLLLSWAYARAEAQALIPVEYTGFLWAALFGWVFFAEALTWQTLAGTALIVVGSVLAARAKPLVPHGADTLPS